MCQLLSYLWVGIAGVAVGVLMSPKNLVAGAAYRIADAMLAEREK